VPGRDALRRFAADVHEGQRLDQDDAVLANEDLARTVLGFPACVGSQPARELVDDDEAGIVPGARVLPARIAQADDET